MHEGRQDLFPRKAPPRNMLAHFGPDRRQRVSERDEMSRTWCSHAPHGTASDSDTCLRPLMTRASPFDTIGSVSATAETKMIAVC